jgi:hypothetical protein
MTEADELRGDLKKAYFIGIRDGFRLARANETAEIDEILDDIKNDFGRKWEAVQAEFIPNLE